MKELIIRAPAATSIIQFEPLLPRDSVLNPLLERAHELQKQCWKLSTNTMPGLRLRLIPLLRAMNSYYTNKIEGQHTLSADIESAMNNVYSAEPDKARRQRLAIAHLKTEEWAEQTYAAHGWRAIFDPAVICAMHQHLYTEMPVADRVTDTGDPVMEGQLRDRPVHVGMHMAPVAETVPTFLNRWKDFYGGLPEGERALVGLACAHHRLAWIHPFRDGNGRIARLQSHLALHAMGLTDGLWSPMRGMARKHKEYYANLINADEHRLGDYDGREALSEKGLISFAEYFFEVCIDQASFMEQMLNLTEFKDRLAALLAFESSKSGSDFRMEALIPLHYIAINGPLDRGSFKSMTGLSMRVAERLLKSLLDFGLLRSNSPKGPVYLGIPLGSLRFLFPNLWPEAEAIAMNKVGK